MHSEIVHWLPARCVRSAWFEHAFDIEEGTRVLSNVWSLSTGDGLAADGALLVEAFAIGDGDAAEQILGILEDRLCIGRIVRSEALVAALSLHGVRMLLVEYGYFDADGRSEASTLYRSQYTTAEELALRLHLFSEVVGRDKFLSLGSGHESSCYLGYLIPRPTVDRANMRVGRTLLRPPNTYVAIDGSTIGQWLVDLEGRVRTMVSEAVEIAGVRLWAQGVPFMQQDRSILSCAHVGTWMALQSMTLQGHCVRVPVADIAAAGSIAGSSRTYPTTGWLDEQVVEALATYGLRPILQPLVGMDEHLTPSWHVRPDIFDEDRQERAGFAQFVARYLNSGIPVIIGAGRHAVVACGYLRNRDRADPTDWEQERPSTVHSLIVHDDEKGPYRTRELADLVGDESNQLTAIVPCPAGMDLGGADAESRASALAEDQIRAAAKRVDTPPTTKIAGLLVAASAELSNSGQESGFALRTYSTLAMDFKAHLQRMDVPANDIVRRLVRLRMPRFVWVTELIRRDLRAQGLPSVLGMVVLDASSGFKQSPPILVWTPGHARVRDLPTRTTVEWHIGDVHLVSGRHGHDGTCPPSDHWSVAQRAKNTPQMP